MSGREQQFLRTIAGETRGVVPSLTRGTLSAIEPFYRGVMWVRNKLFDSGLRKAHRVPRPVISVGNLTTGGTGKTPVVAWLADELRRALGGEIGILIRGYKSRDGMSDEASLLTMLLQGSAAPSVHVIANPDRVAGARATIAQFPGIRAFVMDDGFQHRRLHRDFDLVLIDGTNPFGHNHVLPRGLLRESVRGLRRAHAVLITRSDQASADALMSVRAEIARLNPSTQIYRSSHALVGFRQASLPETSVAEFRGRRVVAFAGIGNPAAFEDSLRRAGCNIVGTLWFADHHRYDGRDMQQLAEVVRSTRADALVTTAKDAVKLPDGGPVLGAPTFVAELRIVFEGTDAEGLSRQILMTLSRGAGESLSGAI